LNHRNAEISLHINDDLVDLKKSLEVSGEVDRNIQDFDSNPPNYVAEIRRSVVVLVRLRGYSQPGMKNKPFLVPRLRIHLAFDGSDHAMVAAQFVSDLPLPRHSRITILGVVQSGQSRYESNLSTALMQAEKILGRKAVETESVLLYGHVAKQLIEYGNEHRPDLMILGAKGPHATLRILLGGVSQQVVQHAHWPVLVARAPYHGLRRVLLATDGSPNTRLAAEYLAQFPLPLHAEIQVVHAQPLLLEELDRFAYNKGPIAYLAPSMPLMADRPTASHRAELYKQRGRVILAEARGILEAAGHKAKGIILDGDPASQILEYSELRGIDLIVAGSRGLSAIEGWWWGSVSRKLVHYAHSSVLFVRTDTEDTSPE
jgi:nucleotide-binding universal stress UspA family protein